MATLIVEIQRPEAIREVQRDLTPMGARLVKPYSNISAFMETSIWLFDGPPGLPLAEVAEARGVIYLEPDEEHILVNCGSALKHFGPFGTKYLGLGPEVSGSRSTVPAIMDMIGAPQAQERSHGGAGIVVLVVDSGVDGSRIPKGQQAGGWTDDPSGQEWQDDVGHGTMVALMALAVAPNANIFSVRTKPGPHGGVMKESVLSAIDALLPIAQQNPDLKLVMNNSWGTHGCEGKPYW